MISNRAEAIAVDSTITGQNIALSIDQAAMAHIMNVLTDLYSDPEKAVIREYSTNALDAQTEAGVTRPIEVITPTPLAPFLTIRDYGVGLSVEDIHDIYSKYGASTKRGTNDQVGMLGLGCKSALTYASQFTVVSVQDGVRVQVVVSRDANGAGSMTVVETSATTEANGTTIQIPARRDNRIESKAVEFFRYWPSGTVLLNGKEPQGIDGIKINDNLWIVESPGYDRRAPTVVMGNVPYPVEDNRLNLGLSYSWSVVARVPIGSVDFAPSRELLHYTPVTQETLSNIEDDFKRDIGAAIQRSVHDAESPAAAIRAVLKWEGVFTRRPALPEWTYKGKKLPGAIKGDFTLSPGDSSVLSRHSSAQQVQMRLLPNTVFVVNWDRPTFTAGQKKKMNMWRHANLTDQRVGSYALLRGHLLPSDKEWLEPWQIVDWKSDIEPIKLPRNAPAAGSSGRIPGSYDVMRKQQGYSWSSLHGMAGDTVNQFAEPLFYYEGNQGSARWLCQTLDTILDEYVLVYMPANRVAKFCRLFPHATEIKGHLRAEAKKVVSKLDKRQLEAYAAHSSGASSTLLKLDPAKVQDPALKRAIKLLTEFPLKSLTKVEEASTFASRWGAPEDKPKGEFKDPLDSYPLFCEYALRSHPEHVYHYINAAYTAGKGVK